MSEHTADNAPPRHASWGTDPSGYCGCEDCNAPDDDAYPPEPCIAPPGNLCTDTGCWDADRCIVTRDIPPEMSRNSTGNVTSTRDTPPTVTNGGDA